METRKFEGEFRKTLTENKEIVGDDVDAGVQLCTKVGDSVLIVFSFMHLAPRASVDRSPCNQDMIARNNFSSVDWLVKSTDPTWGIEIENDSKVGFQFFRSRKGKENCTISFPSLRCSEAKDAIACLSLPSVCCLFVYHSPASLPGSPHKHRAVRRHPNG
ncbi:hypothetical protein MUK42_03325 [Musa troglodytarum]|uniref:Uncharacterized protein n=1 Tax=Musa troglodytarum TaxID=320322 RepID=A0A9E7HJB5_9LILI|nr:hypothetical protein MUK42_03325 [Musa troglodytarum]URE35578.1 hypothetical protein MUK42_03325 [Musa troglodytarum]URE35579.1 hypothetical protein MUK42_03325 [Musa troglodytarum]URE35586.1 hypothetical protein MUK42_03325 [Musa troglodytarum]